MRTPRNERLGSAIPEDRPERKCILSGDHGPRASLVRLAIAPADAEGHCEVLPDVLAKAPGRGAWIGVSRPELEAALATSGKGGGKLRGALARAFKGAALTIPADLAELIEAGLRRSLTDRLGLEMRAGLLQLGSDRIAEMARAGRVHWLGHAADAGEDGSRKLDQAWRVGSDAEGTALRGTVLPLDRAALSVALGRDNAVHLALTDRAAAERVSAALQRLMHYTGRAEANEEAIGGGASSPLAAIGTSDF